MPTLYIPVRLSREKDYYDALSIKRSTNGYRRCYVPASCPPETELKGLNHWSSTGTCVAVPPFQRIESEFDAMYLSFIQKIQYAVHIDTMCLQYFNMHFACVRVCVYESMLTFMHFHFIYHVFSYTYACYFLEGDQVNHGPWSIFFRKKHHLLQFTSASISLLTNNYLCTVG
jgi:hypothetical protein